MVRWEKFLPRMVLRVLLVEADDSTRHIIAALLRKCSYRVAAVPDGLKAWEMLKRKASDIDLILTEVELPSISGFALLTLIMEHDICKNIPVIMMSSNDSVNMALKCILKGAADFLIKPVRRNELRNLWQHVWRRLEISRQPQNLTFPKKELEVTSENNAASNDSSGSVASTQKNNGCSEKVSEAQNMQGTSLVKSSSNLSNTNIVQHEESTKMVNEAAEKPMALLSLAAKCNKNFNSKYFGLEQGHHCAGTESQEEVLREELSRGNPDMDIELHDHNKELLEPSRGAIDLIATFQNLPEKNHESCSLSDCGAKKFDFDPRLELSLRRDFLGSSCKQTTDEKQALNHSNASAFSRTHICRYSESKFPTPSISSAKVSNTEWNTHESNKLFGKTVDTSHQYSGTNHSHENVTATAIGQCGRELQSPNSQIEPSPDTGITSDHKSTGYGHLFPSTSYAQSGVHTIWNPKPVNRKESSPSPFPTSNSFQSNPGSHNSERGYHRSDDATNTSLDQTVHEKSNLDSLTQDPPATDQSTNNSLCHETANNNQNNNTSACKYTSRSDGNATSAAIGESNPESFGDSAEHNYDGFIGIDSHRPSPREAALTKFRMKRKDRCYEKKVRYQSRKKLAEQRPRVKGQFVRLVHNNDHPIPDAGGGS
ncbi:two-component response regulator-like PRR95 isoform X1 [Senna tora]|uniref:Two-component response regulator-like PRR95 isoform X1 n=1 Tax=Senna tora TaxID=362788 RepID=A0A834XGE2_9FABA|nr:two-component response regulator-like PRR95 isoform X1 [Senna tora]